MEPQRQPTDTTTLSIDRLLPDLDRASLFCNNQLAISCPFDFALKRPGSSLPAVPKYRALKNAPAPLPHSGLIGPGRAGTGPRLRGLRVLVPVV